MISNLDGVDLSKGVPHKRKIDGLEVMALEMKEDFQIVLPDNAELVDHERSEPEVVEKDGRKEVVLKKIPAKRLVIHAYGGTIRGRAGDYICAAKDGFIFAVSNRVKETREAPESLFENTFEPI